MSEQTNNKQLFLREAEIFIEKVRNSLCAQTPTQELLADSVAAVADFKKVTNEEEMDSFRSIANRLEVVFNRHLTAQTTPSRIELETVELAVDWLAQLAILYEENLPEPKSLVAELLYTFDLVESSQDATSLVELVAANSEKGFSSDADPFLEDPEFDIQERPVFSRRDPFADDPGFGLEFDLLQRTVSFVVETKKLDDDPFSGDPSLNSRGDKNLSVEAATTSSPYDVFAGDPPLADNPDNDK